MMRIGRKNSHLTDRSNAETKEIRNFGLLFAALGVFAGAFMVWKENHNSWIAFGLAGIFLLMGLFLPRLLGPFYRVWMRFAALLAWVNTRVLLTVFFFVVLTPIALMMKLFGKDLLNQKFDRSARSYWVKRTGTGTDRESYEHLF
jgi:hypothetical protein